MRIDDGIQSQGHEIVALRLYLAFPQAFGDDAEHASAIEVVNAVGDGGKFEIAQGHALHGMLASLKAYHCVTGLDRSGRADALDLARPSKARLCSLRS